MGGYENLGPVVSQNPQGVTPGGGSFSSDERSYESVVYQQGCPPMDWEMNLLQSVVGNSGVRNATQKLLPSGFITGSFSESESPGSSYEFLAPVAGNENLFNLKACDVVVNGWNLKLEFTDSSTSGYNNIFLPVPPLSGTKRNLVILEVWRALLSPLPSVDNKSPAGQIYRHGNAKAPDGAPYVNVNLSDDLIDPNWNKESSRRVQIQYRIRVIEDVDIVAYSDGLDDPSVTVTTVPYLGGSGVDGSVLGAYSYAPHPTDPGLWYAGSGDIASASDIGSVDGYIYAIPVCLVSRRNSDTFNKLLNVNGGSDIASGTPTRPDGLFCDQIVADDVIDLRKTVAYDPLTIREAAINSLFQNKLGTQYEFSSSGTGGNTLLVVDQLNNGGHLGNTDGVRITFSDRRVVQSIAVQVLIAAPTPTFSVDLNNLDLPWQAGVDIISNAPVGTSLLSVNKAYYDNGAGSVIDLFNPIGLNPYIKSITYSNTPVDTATIELDSNINAGMVVLEISIEYPPNSGLSRNCVDGVAVWVPSTLPIWADATQFTAAPNGDINRSYINSSYSFSNTNREVSLVYPSNMVITCYTITSDTIMVPDIVDDTSIILDGGHGVVNCQKNSGCTIITINPPEPPGTPIQVTYTAYRPAPSFTILGDTIEIFYKSRAIQSIPVPVGSHTPKFIKRTGHDRGFLITAGSGNPNSSIYDSGAQLPITLTPLNAYSDSLLFTDHEITTKLGYDNLGFAKIPSFSYYLESAEDFFLKTVNLGPDTQDSCYRNYWPLSKDFKISFAENISGSVYNRKICSDFILELAEDFAGYGRKGSLFLAVASSYDELRTTNSIELNSTTHVNGISLYRLRGNPIYCRRES